MMGSSRWKIAVMVFFSIAGLLMPVESDEHEHTVRTVRTFEADCKWEALRVPKIMVSFSYS